MALNNPKNYQLKEDEPGGSYVTRGRVAKCLRYFDVENREERNLLGRPWRRWEDFKTDLQQTGWMTWTLYGSGYGQMEGSCEHGNEHSVSIKRGKILV